MADKPWKRAERRVAAKLGGKRVPITGRQRGDVPDVQHDDYSPEVKLRKSYPNWLKDAIDQARKAAKQQQLPIVVLVENGKSLDDAMVVVPFREFVEWAT